MKKEHLEKAALIAFGVVLYAIFMNMGAFLEKLEVFIGYFMPFIAGLLIAFVFSVPVKLIEDKLVQLIPKLKKGKLSTILGLIVTFVILGGIVTVLSVNVGPVIRSSIAKANEAIIVTIPQWLTVLEKYHINTKAISDFLTNLQTADITSLIGNVTSGAGSVMDGVIGAAKGTISGIITAVLAIVISVYVIADNKTVIRHLTKLTDGIFSKKASGRIKSMAKLIYDTYQKFLTGQCLEALIMGMLIFIVMTVMQVPYALLIAVLTAVLSFIPYIGAFLAFAIGVLLVLLENPAKLLFYAIAFLLTQFVEEQFIYPHVVGNSVGLSPLITLVSIIIGGSLFGLLGMIFFIPLVSVLYTLTSQWINERIKAREETE